MNLDRNSNPAHARLRWSKHARVRLRQRAATPDMVELVLCHGTVSHHGGDEVYVLTDRSLVGTPHERKADRLRGLCVVLTQDGTVRTVMWNHRVRHRPGRLRRGHQAP